VEADSPIVVLEATGPEATPGASVSRSARPPGVVAQLEREQRLAHLVLHVSWRAVWLGRDGLPEDQPDGGEGLRHLEAVPCALQDPPSGGQHHDRQDRGATVARQFGYPPVHMAARPLWPVNGQQRRHPLAQQLALIEQRLAPPLSRPRVRVEPRTAVTRRNRNTGTSQSPSCERETMAVMRASSLTKTALS